MTVDRRRWLLAVAVVAVVACAAVYAARKLLRDPDVSFLAPRSGASWILYPHVPRAGIRPAATLDATFRKTFRVSAADGAARLEVMAFRSGEVRLDGRPVARLDGADWKRVRTFDLPGGLTPGEHSLEAVVLNDRGPPALWLRLVAGDGVVSTDGEWSASLAGASWRGARLAGRPLDPSPLDPEGVAATTWDGPRRRWPAWIAMAIVAGLAVAAGSRWRTVGPAWLLPAAVAIAWCALAVNNAPSLTLVDGYDASGHAEYIRYVQEQRSLPAADAGWSTFQPPLYYVLTALALELSGRSVPDPGAGYVLRLLGAALGAVQVLLVFASARIVFPERAGAAAAATIAAACAPVVMHTYQFVGNDALAATLASAAVYLTLRIVAAGRESVAIHAGLGLIVGAALLSKTTVLPVALVLLAVVGVRAARDGMTGWLRTAGISLAVTGVTCGWHYLSVARRFGRPLVGNWSPDVLAPWWQDPGFATPAPWLRFGRALVAPVYSALWGVWDGLYSTLWGDGLVSGRLERWMAPPWDPALSSGGYLLALIPTALLLAGFVILVRRGCLGADRAALTLGLCAVAQGAALIVWPMRLTIYSVIKAEFALPAMVPLALCIAAGLDRARERLPKASPVLAVLFLLWGINAYAAHWIPRGSPAARARLAWIESSLPGREALAERHARAALERDPDHPLALLALARVDAARGDDAAAAERLRSGLSRHPSDSRLLRELGRLRVRQGMEEAAAGIHADLLRARPGDPESLWLLARSEAARGRDAEASEHLREALAAVPEDPEVHRLLADVLDRLGDGAAAVRHRARAETLDGASEGLP